jgi:hypothetical protein
MWPGRDLVEFFSINSARFVPLYFATSTYFVPLETMLLRLTFGTSCWKKIHITLLLRFERRCFSSSKMEKAGCLAIL